MNPETEQYSIIDGRIECVMWIIVDGESFLVEKRPSHLPGESICIPCGHVDLNCDFNDYLLSAFIREVREEFGAGEFIPTDFYYLTSIDFDEINDEGLLEKLRLHYFVIQRWTGEVPLFTREDGEIHSELLWYSLTSFMDLPQSCDREALQVLVNKLKYDTFR